MSRHFLTVRDFSSEDLLNLFERTVELKTRCLEFQAKKPLAGKSLAMVFQKPSNRTRISFDVGMYQLGGLALNIRPNEISMGERESIADVSRVLSRYVDIVMLRLLRHEHVMEFAEYSTVPVINGLSDLHHPCQALADLFTVLETKGKLKGVRFAYVGDGGNVCNSLIDAAELLGMELSICTPPGYEPYRTSALRSTSFVKTPIAAVTGADVVYTDVWTSMGQEKEREQRLRDFQSHRVTMELLSHAKADVIFMHCLPARRGEEVTDEVMESSHSVIFDQAENRMHTQKALLLKLLQS